MKMCFIRKRFMARIRLRRPAIPFILIVGLFLLNFLKNFSSDTIIVKTPNFINTNSQTTRPDINNSTKHLINRNSFQFWKSLDLKPEYKTGKAKNVRFGEPLRLFSLQNTENVELQDRIAWKMDGKLPNPKTNGLLDCKDLFLGHGSVTSRTQTEITASLQRNFQLTLQAARNSCAEFKHNSGYIMSPLTLEEAHFPIAFSIVIFKDVEQFEILLRAIYRPQNVYCIHIDKKSPDVFRQSVDDLVQCFDNVFVASTSIDVEWGTFKVLEPDIVCARELYQHKIRWKYFINLTGQEMPMRTNYELMRILKAFNGSNNVESTPIEHNRLTRSGPPPFGLKPIKGAVHVVLSRAFVHFMLHNETALDIYEWSRKVKHASEVFFSTLNFNPSLAAPGSYKGFSSTTSDKNRFLARLKIWQGEGFCGGKMSRRICILSPAELPRMGTGEELFANKLHFDYHPEMQVCMPELLFNRTVDEYNGLLLFNDTYYRTRDFVRNKF